MLREGAYLCSWRLPLVVASWSSKGPPDGKLDGSGLLLRRHRDQGQKCHGSQCRDGLGRERRVHHALCNLIRLRAEAFTARGHRLRHRLRLERREPYLYAHQHRGQADQGRQVSRGHRDHPGRQGRLRHQRDQTRRERPGNRDPDQYAHQHRGQADQGRQGSPHDRDHPGRQDCLRPQHLLQPVEAASRHSNSDQDCDQ